MQTSMISMKQILGTLPVGLQIKIKTQYDNGCLPRCVGARLPKPLGYIGR